MSKCGGERMYFDAPNEARKRWGGVPRGFPNFRPHQLLEGVGLLACRFIPMSNALCRRTVRRNLKYRGNKTKQAEKDMDLDVSVEENHKEKRTDRNVSLDIRLHESKH
jgi:hypothetical protein